MSFGATPTAVDDVELAGAYAFELVSLCDRLGVPADALLAGTGLTLTQLQAPGSRLSLATCAVLIERARRLTGQPALAILLGMQMRLSWHGFLGFAAMTASTLREALDLGQRFSLTRTAACEITSYVEGGVASVVLEEHLPPGELREFVVLAVLVGVVTLARELTGHSLRGVAEVAFPEPPYVMPVLERAGKGLAGSIAFGKPSHRLVFDATILDLPLLKADPAAMQLAREQCDRELAAVTGSADVVGRVRALVARGDSVGSLDDVAKRLHVSPRTLKRRLAERGTTFSNVAEAVRQQKALLLLADQRLAIADVAERLGYSDVANFTRAFRRWTRLTPAAFRRR